MSIAKMDSTFDRRKLLTGAVALAPLAFGRLHARAATATPPAATPEPLMPPNCQDGDLAPTPAQTQGPYFTPGSPERSSLREAGMAGTPLEVAGFVVTTECAPLPMVKLDFWQADAAGVYDNQGYTLRGHQFSGKDGSYRLETVIPGEYPGRTEHIHVMLTTESGQTLTTQLYFPGVPHNESDGIFNPALVVAMEPERDGFRAWFDFVLPPA